MNRRNSMTSPTRFALWLLTMVTLGGCGDVDLKPQTDEAMKRADFEGVDNESAARFFTYRDDHAVPDFFQGMDALVTRSSHSIPDQLLGPDTPRPYAPVKDVQLAESVTGNHSEIIGRNTWMMWCGGNEGFWDYLATDSLGFIDLVKLVDSRNRNRRFRDAGMINEPEMNHSDAPAEHEFGLWLDRPEDPRFRQWRTAYLKQTFEQLANGTHVSQIGLRKRDVYGEFNGPPLYKGKASEDATKRRYRYPSSYLPEDQRQTLYDAATHSDNPTRNTVISPAETSVDVQRRSPHSKGDPQNHASKDGNNDKQSTIRSAYGARYNNPYDQSIPPPDMYGISSGVIGLRLFPNPYFDAEAQAKWNAEKYYSDKSYYTDPKLIRPFRVGMSCAFCHASFHPLRPPKDVHHPEWKNLSGSIGAQYLSMRATVGNLLEPENFVYHLLESQPRGTIDTSLIASDNINNPNTMNAVFGLQERAILSLHNPQEHLSKASAALPSLWDDLDPKGRGPLGSEVNDPVPEYWRLAAEELGVTDRIEQSNENPRYVPRILLDGSDSIGTWGALARVYLNIGTYWEQWNELHQVVVGFTPQRPFLIADCETNSVYWNATEKRVPGLRDYFLRVTPPMPLLSTEDAGDRLKTINEDAVRAEAQVKQTSFGELLAKRKAQHVDLKQLAHGRKVFAKNCIVCHSSIQPESAVSNLFTNPEERKNHLNQHVKLIKDRLDYRQRDSVTKEFWEHDPARWLDDPNYLRWALEVVEKPSFWKNNFLSTDYRIPINVVKTNSARAMATNAMTGHMWEDFASESYRMLPSPGAIEFFNPYKGDEGEWDSFLPRHQPHQTAPDDLPKRGGGPGYYRVPSLISVWATAPYLHNNSLGLFNNDPSVDGRLEAFDDGIRKLLWKEKRLQSSSYNGATAERLQRDHGLIWRTPIETHLTIDSKRVPTIAQGALPLGMLQRITWLKWLHYVSPTWLASAVLLLGALLTLLLSNSELRKPTAIGILIFALLLSLAQWIAWHSPHFSILSFIGKPGWLPIAIALGIVGVTFGLPIWGHSKIQKAGATVLAVAILLAVLGGLHVRFPDFSVGGVLRQIAPWWLPVAALVFVGIVLLLPRITPAVRRTIGYGTALASILVGVVVYYNAGKLGDVTIGPIPAGTPVNLLANFNPEADESDQLRAIDAITSGLAEIKSRNLPAAETQKVMRKKIAPALMSVNKCPDFVMDQGHYFPWFDDMTDEDKNALIELLKTF